MTNALGGLAGWPMLKATSGITKTEIHTNKMEEFHAIHHRKRRNGDLL